MGMMINRRRAYGGKKLPYDYEVEYLQSSGTQYIDTGIYPAQVTRVEAVIQFTKLVHSSVFGSFNGESQPHSGWNNLFGINVTGAATDGMWCQWGDVYTNTVKTKNTLKHFFTFERNGDVSWTFGIDGKTATTAHGVYTQPTNNQRVMYLFACNRDGTLYRQAYVKIYNFKVQNNGALVLDYIPVVKDGVGYMYDKVSGKLFGNNGTGSFIVGPRKPEWVDLALPSGKLWADRNIGANSETDAGYYFSWGNIDGHTAGDGYSFDSTNYNSSPGASLTGNISDTDAVHNAACAILGGGATMPSTADFKELFNSNNTTRQRTQVNGVNGYLLTSVRNGKTLFLPTSGLRDGSSTTYFGSGAAYWSSVFNTASSAYGMLFNVGGEGTVNTAYPSFRRQGFSIRAIKSNN